SSFSRTLSHPIFSWRCSFSSKRCFKTSSKVRRCSSDRYSWGCAILLLLHFLSAAYILVYGVCYLILISFIYGKSLVKDSFVSHQIADLHLINYPYFLWHHNLTFKNKRNLLIKY